jgi:SAM-dependent methyltransferase
MGRREERGHRLFAAVYCRLTAMADRGWLGEARHALLSGARGDVLEIGAGTGANLAHLPEVDRVVVAEPDPAMRRRLAAAVARREGGARMLDARAESLPLPDGSVDTMLATLVLCSVDDPARARWPRRAASCGPVDGCSSWSTFARRAGARAGRISSPRSGDASRPAAARTGTPSR